MKYHVRDLYGIEVATCAITAITDQLIPALKEWQQRPLNSVYPIIWMDAIHYKIREEGRYISKEIYSLLGLMIDEEKEILGIYLSDNESASHWLSVLTDLQNRGVDDILIACIDGLSGFPDAITSIFPRTEIQLCIIHQIRNSMKYIASKNQKMFMADLKLVYRASVAKGLQKRHWTNRKQKGGIPTRLSLSPGVKNGRTYRPISQNLHRYEK